MYNWKVIDNEIVGEVETQELVQLLRELAAGRRLIGFPLEANIVELAATRLEALVKIVPADNVYPDWYERLSSLDYNYSPVADKDPWYRAEDVWACIESVSEEHREFGGTDGNT